MKYFIALLLSTSAILAAPRQVPTLFKVKKPLLAESTIQTYDQERRFIWTCYAVSGNPIEMTSKLYLSTGRLCLCHPGGSVDGIGLHVSHVKTVQPTKSEHLAYREIFLEKNQCQSFAAYSP